MYKRIFALASIAGFFILLVAIYFASQPSEAEKSILLTTSDYKGSVAADIRNAEQYVYAATYLVEAYSDNAILSELESAKMRGVEVRLMFDYQSIIRYPTILKDLADLNIPYKVISGHAKLAVIDNKFAYVGSSNWNRKSLEENWELNLRTNTASTVSEAYQYLDLLWEQGRKPIVYKDNSPERFVNGEEFYNLLIEKLENAESIKVLNYKATYDYANPDAIDSKVFNSVKNAYDNGATLQIVLDDSEYRSWSSARDYLVENRIPHKLDELSTNQQILHVKVILIDDKVLFIGSHNLDDHSLLSNQQTSIMTTDQQTISDFLVIFEEKWESSVYPSNDGGEKLV